MSAERLGWARELMAQHLESGRTPSVVAVVLRHGKAVFVESFGVKEPGGAPLEPHHMWPIASAGKPLTAATLLSLVEDGAVGLHDPLTDYFPELNTTDHGEVLVHHVLTHTTGWESAQRTLRAREVALAGGPGEPPPGRDPGVHFFLSLALDPIVATAPGVRMDYDGFSFELAAEIVRRVTGGSLDEAMRARILDPLGMTATAVQVSDAQRPDIVHRDPDLPLGMNQPVTFDGPGPQSNDVGAGGLFAAPSDLVTFGEMIRLGGTLGGQRLLSPATVRAMTTDQIPGLPAVFGERLIRNASWGLGFTVISEEVHPYFMGGLVPVGSVAHPGAGGTSFWVDFTNGIVGAFFEVITEMSDFVEPISGIGHRFQDIVTAAVES